MIFLDSGNIEEIKKYSELGIISGITTNPTILKKDGIKDVEEFVDVTRNYFSGHISLEVTSNDLKTMKVQAKYLSSLSHDISVKIPIHGPEGELYYLKGIRKLSKEGISVNVTAMMSAQQCMIAATLGANYISLFGGRVNNMGYNCIDEIRKTRELLDKFNLKSKLIIGSTRETLNIIEWLLAGADIITVAPNLMNSLIVHPYSKETVKIFLEDAKNG